MYCTEARELNCPDVSIAQNEMFCFINVFILGLLVGEEHTARINEKLKLFVQLISVD